MNDRRSFIGSIFAAIAGLWFKPRIEPSMTAIRFCHDATPSCDCPCCCNQVFIDDFSRAEATFGTVGEWQDAARL